MLDPKKHMEMHEVSVAEFVSWLIHNVPMDAKFNVNGDNLFYTHVEEDGSVISVDDSELSDEYPEDDCEATKYTDKR